MALYAEKQGIAAEDIIIENKARNTRENILFPKNWMTNGSRFAIISNYYHLFRALLLAKELEISALDLVPKLVLLHSMPTFENCWLPLPQTQTTYHTSQYIGNTTHYFGSQYYIC